MALPAALMVVGAGLSAQAQLSGANEEARSLDSLSRQFIEEGILNAQDFERQSSARLASARASRAASGVDLSSGSALLVEETSLRNIAEGVIRIREEAERRAKAARRAAKRARKGGMLGAAGTILSAGAGAFK